MQRGAYLTTNLWLACGLLAAAGPGVPARGQAPPPAAAPASPPAVGAPAAPAAPGRVFAQVIPRPTGRNGYEELVLAAETLASSRLYDAAERAGSTTLAEKRRVLADPVVQRALELLRRGLGKPVRSPRDSVSYDTLLPEMAQFRRLARLLSLQQYVLLADGRVPEAIQTARTCLRLGRAVQTDTLISGLVGVAISSIGINSLGRHLDQLGARECELLFRVCLEWLSQPDLGATMLDADRVACGRAFQDLIPDIRRRGVDALADLLGLKGNDRLEAETWMRRVDTSSDESVRRFVQDIISRVDAYYLGLRAQWTRPHWERQFTAPQEKPDADPAALLAGSLIPNVGGVSNAYAREAASMRLLACHGAIRRYRWEHERLPASLAVLRLGDLALDPFTGLPLRYELLGNRYRLQSAGPTAAADDAQAVDGRRPVSVTTDD